MNKETLKINIGEAKFRINLRKERGFIYYDIVRNNKVQVAGQMPKKMEKNLKMYLAQHLIFGAIYEIHYQLEKLS